MCSNKQQKKNVDIHSNNESKEVIHHANFLCFRPSQYFWPQMGPNMSLNMSHSNIKSTTFSITSLDFTVNTTITDLIKWTPLGSITLIIATQLLQPSECIHYVWLHPQRKEISDDLGDVFPDEICGALWISAHIAYPRNTYKNTNLERTFHLLKCKIVLQG